MHERPDRATGAHGEGDRPFRSRTLAAGLSPTLSSASASATQHRGRWTAVDPHQIVASP
jgi:hypothetical protein